MKPFPHHIRGRNFFDTPLGRRSFLKQSLLGVAVTLTGDALLRPLATLGAPSKTTIGVFTGKNKRNITMDAVDAIGGIGRFVKSGMRVVIKPNIGWDRTPALGANTHPDVVRTVVMMCLDAGAKRVTVLDRTCHDARRTYISSGIKDAVEGIDDSRARVEYVDKKKFIPLDIPRGKALTRWEFYRDVVEADSLINIPVAKSHGTTTLTLSIKNLMGVIGGNRGTIHWNIDQKLADIATLITPTLNILDATRVMVKGGPSGGNIQNVRVMDTVIAGTDPVAVDSYGTTLFGMRGIDIGHIKEAYDRGIGEIYLKNIIIVGS
jgi:uncharacterized protein (DUF362 family)